VNPCGRDTVRCVRVEVIRSARRRKTVQAREVDGVLRVSVPAGLAARDEQRWVAEMVRRMERRTAGGTIDLAARAEALAQRYDLPRPAAIRWVDNQRWRWGSCTPSDRTIRISSRLAGEPGWVLDYVIVHELAHLRAPGHDGRFWSLVERYPRTERARGFLMARGLEPGFEDQPDVDSPDAGTDGSPRAPDRDHSGPPKPARVRDSGRTRDPGRGPRHRRGQAAAGIDVEGGAQRLPGFADDLSGDDPGNGW
jgi:predicted metal-dependent hydrolase